MKLEIGTEYSGEELLQLGDADPEHYRAIFVGNNIAVVADNGNDNWECIYIFPVGLPIGTNRCEANRQESFLTSRNTDALERIAKILEEISRSPHLRTKF